MEKAGHPWAVPVALDDIPDTGLHMEIDADAETRAALAAHAGVREVPQLFATFDLVRLGAGVHVTGRVQARVGQTCVVTLDPIENTIDEAVDVQFVPGADAAEAGHVVDMADEDEEPPVPLVGGKVDLGALVTEFLLLGIDPYPRKPGVEFAPPQAAEAGGHPFSGLEALKKPLGGGNS
jgi:uncharacterized metal-binding protein YceD (DUF177 family)